RHHAAVDRHTGEAGALEVEARIRTRGGELAAPPFQAERGVHGRLGQAVDEAVEPERVDAADHAVSGLLAPEVEAAFQVHPAPRRLELALNPQLGERTGDGERPARLAAQPAERGARRRERVEHEWLGFERRLDLALTFGHGE